MDLAIFVKRLSFDVGGWRYESQCGFMDVEVGFSAGQRLAWDVSERHKLEHMLCIQELASGSMDVADFLHST